MATRYTCDICGAEVPSPSDFLVLTIHPRAAVCGSGDSNRFEVCGDCAGCVVEMLEERSGRDGQVPDDED